jgi:hypothetical protein
MLGVLKKGLVLAVAEIKKFVDGKHGVLNLDRMTGFAGFSGRLVKN